MNGRDLGDRLRRQERLSLFGYGDRSVTGLADTTDNRSNRSRVLIVGAFSAIYVLWGSTYLAIAIAVQTIPPFLLIGIRSLGAGAILLAGSVIAFTAYVWLLDHARAPLVATYTFVNPIIAVGLGWAALGERLTLPMLPGFGLVVGSVIAVWRLDAA